VWGILYYHGGNNVARYAWDLGQDTKNQVKAYTLLWGIHITIKEKNKILKLIGDSMVVIKYMIGKVTLMDNKITTTMEITWNIFS